ncbi:MAG TPA: hypothetical protein VMC48_06130 [Methanobacterium sp.]|nr:hypothetical protein [Methanobacterium sp.]
MIPELIDKFLEDGVVSKKQHNSLSPLKKPYGEKLGKFLYKGEYSSPEVLNFFLEENEQFLFDTFHKYLNDNSVVADAIIWRGEDGVKPYNQWPKEDKLLVSHLFWEDLLDLSSRLEETPPCTVNLDEDGDIISTDLKPADAWKYYIHYVSHTLRVELDRLVHWSILRYNQRQMEYLLDSRTLFEYAGSREVYSIFKRHDSLFNHGSTTPGDPLKTYDFLDKEKLVGITRWGTIGLVLGWCRDNLCHFKDGNTPKNHQDHWQYEGYPPVQRIISGTKHPDLGFHHFTAGCWGTTGFLRTVLRTINIPVLLEEQCGHALPHFVYSSSHEFYLSHGDDPYNKLYKTSTPKFPPLDLIINHYKYDKWFDKDLPQETVCNNVGRHAIELAVEYLPTAVLEIYCKDQMEGIKPEDGRLYNEVFKNHISLKEMYEFGFWGRLRYKVGKLGGCETILKRKD